MSNTPSRKHRRLNSEKPQPTHPATDDVKRAPEPEEGQQTDTAPESELNMAAVAITQARDNFGLAMSLLPDSREKSLAITNFDTALLWSSEALKVAQIQQQQAKRRLDQMARRFNPQPTNSRGTEAAD